MSQICYYDMEQNKFIYIYNKFIEEEKTSKGLQQRRTKSPYWSLQRKIQNYKKNYNENR